MTGIGAVGNNAPMAQVHAPPTTAKAKGSQDSVAISGQGNQTDTLSISQEAIQALEDALGGMTEFGKHHHHHRGSVEDVLTYKNFQSQGNHPGVAQAHQSGTAHSGNASPSAKVAEVGSAGGSGAAKA